MRCQCATAGAAGAETRSIVSGLQLAAAQRPCRRGCMGKPPARGIHDPALRSSARAGDSESEAALVPTVPQLS